MSLGSKNAGGQRHRSGQNPVRNFMDYLFYKDPELRHKITPFASTKEGMPVKDMFAAEWENTEMNIMDPREMNRMLQEQWFREENMINEQRRMMEFQNEAAWKEAKIEAERKEIQERMNQYTDEFMRLQEEEKLAEGWDEAEYEIEKTQNVDEQAVIKDAATDMLQVMQADPDPKFQNSKFLEFLKKIESGAVKIENNALVQNEPEEFNSEFKDFENVWQAEEQKLEHNNMDSAWKEEEEKFKGDEQIFEQAWDKMYNAEEVEKELEDEYKKLMEQYEKADPSDYEKMFADIWNVQQDREELELYGDVPDQYKFNESNPYLQDANPLSTSLELANKGKTREAILALESHLQKHPEDVHAWRLMGRFYQENDQDRIAVTCLQKANKLDPKDLDTLLALGVSCTNILDQIQAMNHLKNWLLINDKYKNIKIDPNLIPENTQNGLPIEQIKDINARLIQIFEAGRQTNPQDPELLTSLAVLYFISTDYKNSVYLFNEALKFDQTNYSLWNKLGATLAHLGRTDDAMDAYKNALEYRPNYVRCWVNLGIAHAFKGDYEQAIQLYLNALAMNPNAKHVWGYLQTCFISLQRWDLVTKVKDEKVEAFRDEFEIINPEDLPAPEIEYKELNERYLIKQNSENWINEFK